MERKHPRGIWNLFLIEMWERFGFYIMSAVYVLYMEKDLHFDDAKKGVLYGLFLFASYIFPLLGGWLGDKVLGQLRTIRLGASMMALGYLALALSSLDRIALFYIGLALIASGTGIFKVNMSVLVGNLYRNRPDLKDAGFNIYYMGVNLGATIAPGSQLPNGACADLVNAPMSTHTSAAATAVPDGGDSIISESR